ncbi:hypothetical protein [Nonomuraea glycinis]|uniref:hypothetical protein n=1 Tax=Nonomuraea glycinis TaxID=2047744 RepID=UPI002E1661CD|nr:hypothetical protein OHA68_41710 [Nonomuraea glycinis]
MTSPPASTRVPSPTLPPGALLAMAALTGLQVTFQEQDGRLFLWVLDQADPRRWTLTTYTPGQPEYEVYQLGDRFVWDEVTDAYFRWVSWGEPSRDGFGAMLTPDGLRSGWTTYSASFARTGPDHLGGPEGRGVRPGYARLRFRRVGLRKDVTGLAFPRASRRSPAPPHAVRGRAQ